MQEFIKDMMTSLYPYINERNTPYLTKKEIADQKLVATNCGINSKLLFSLLKKYNVDKNTTKHSIKIADIDFNQSSVYKIFNIWNERHSHVAVFYYYEDKWIFVESTEHVSGLRFNYHDKQSLVQFLTDREVKSSTWQEICQIDAHISKVNIMLNKLRLIEKYNNQ